MALDFQKSFSITDRAGEHKYKINMMTSKRALKVLAKLTRLLGVPLAQFFVNRKDEVANVLPVAMQSLVDRMDDDDALNLIIEMCSCVKHEGEMVSDTFDNHFQGRIGSLFKLLVEVVKYQYEDFLSVAISAGAKEMAQGRNPQTPSNG